MFMKIGLLVGKFVGLVWQSGKLLFESARYKLPVIANQSADWCGNPPDRGEMYRKAPRKTEVAAIFSSNRYLVPFNRGIATPVCALAR
ncbi:MAG: hypothetical protein SPI15_02090, partial [Candidatus Faecousia sp.]|nr:hypothetical protein [Candidatus Faecousia sp.]